MLPALISESRLKQFVFVWGVLGVAGLLFSAIGRLLPWAMEALALPLSPWQWIAVLLWTLYMAYAEGYKGFHRAFAPRVAARADWLRHHPAPLRVLLAPLFCMGFFHATRRRLITSWAVTTGIVLLVLAVRLLPQPWRGMVDCGVVAGLVLGLASLLYHAARLLAGHPPACPPDVPAAEAPSSNGP